VDARPPEAINIGAVVRLTEADSLAAECFHRENSNCVITPACHFRKVLGEAIDAFYEVLGKHTLSDLVVQRRSLSRLLSIPIEVR
jgi:Rrf2 family nitric oxide-sensitive transcriptional repressor